MGQFKYDVETLQEGLKQRTRAQRIVLIFKKGNRQTGSSPYRLMLLLQSSCCWIHLCVRLQSKKNTKLDKRL